MLFFLWFSMLVSASAFQFTFSGISYSQTSSTRKSIKAFGPRMISLGFVISNRAQVKQGVFNPTADDSHMKKKKRKEKKKKEKNKNMKDSKERLFIIYYMKKV